MADLWLGQLVDTKADRLPDGSRFVVFRIHRFRFPSSSPRRVRRSGFDEKRAEGRSRRQGSSM